MKNVDGEGTCDGPLQVTLRHTSHPGAQLETRTSEIIETNRENILVFVQFKPVLHSPPKSIASKNLIVFYYSFL